MNILLLQEMSGVHTELRTGLRKLGYSADIATLGDSFKNYKSDIFLGNNKDSVLGNLSRIITQLNLKSTFKKYDIIQTISPTPFHRLILNHMEKSTYYDKKMIYVAAGSDPIYRQHVEELKYAPPHDEFKNDNKYNTFIERLKKFNHIIPVCWEYEYAMNQAGFKTEPILPFPISIDEQPVKKINSDTKLRIFHPLNRTNLNFDFKGTLIIQEAFQILKKKYGNKAEFICKGNMNYKEYDTFTNSMDIIVDQTYSYSYGMSAAYGLAKGKVVLSGLEDTARSGFYKDCPVINLTPKVSDIVDKIEILIENRKLTSTIAEESRNFAEKYHDNQKVAEKYLEIYNSHKL